MKKNSAGAAEEFRKFGVVEKACDECGSKFYPRASHQRFCTRLCAGTNRRRRFQTVGKASLGKANCLNCGLSFAQKATNHSYCSIQCRNEQQQKRPSYIDRRLWDYYKLRYADLESALEQQKHRCSICLESFDETRAGRWVIDHDHSCCTNVPACGRCNRGVICADCNTALGMARDDPATIIRAADYLRDNPLPDFSNRQKHCEICAAEFSPYRSSSKYCSKECAKEGAKQNKKAGRKPEIKVCSGCGLDFLRWHPAQKYCGRSCTERNWSKDNNLVRFWTSYRLPEEEAKALIAAQNDSCAICQQKFGTDFRKRPHVDHDHTCCVGPPTCGACNRGIVCGNCNTLLAKVGDRVDVLLRGAEYLHKEQRLVSSRLAPAGS